MKDKKSIAIVVLAAITAGVGLFSIVSHQSNTSEYNKLSQQRDQGAAALQDKKVELEQLTKDRNALDKQRQDLEKDLTDSQGTVQTLTADKTQLENDIKQKDLTYGEQLAAKADELKVANDKIKMTEDALAGKNTQLETAAKDLEQAKADLATVNQNLTTAQENIAKEKEALAQLKAEFDTAVVEGKKAMTELEGKYDLLNQEKGALEVKVTDLDNEIAETNKKLTESEGDRAFLEGELTRLQDEKSELVAQMNNLEFVTTQYKQLRSDFREAQRLDWARRGVGIYAKRETIIERNARLRGEALNPVSIAKDPSVPDKVQVELTSDGKVKINGKLVEPVNKDDETPAPQPEVINPVAPTPVPGQN